MSSIETRTNPATGVTRYRVRFRLDGVNKAVPFTTLDGAERWQALLDVSGPAKALEAITAPRPTVTRTVAEQVAHHIDHLTGITDGTRKRYRDNARRHLNHDTLGRTPLALAGRDDYAAWVNRLDAQGLSAKTIRNNHSVVSDALRSAVRDGLIATNHAEGIRIASPDEDDHDEKTYLTFREVWTFIAATPEFWRPMVTFMFGTGVRWQEASSLKVGDVDLERRQARITRAWKDTAGNGHQLGKPKSKRSRRTIVFGEAVANALRPLVDGRGPDEFVFTNTRGGPVRRSNFHDQAWAPGRHAVGGDTQTRAKSKRGRPRTVWTLGPGKHPTPHDARHTYASLQIARGEPLTFIQRQLGHESLTTTNEIYGHLLTEDLRSLDNVIDPPRQIGG